MALKFAANLSFMFTECPNLLSRYQLAKEAGFHAVESGFPFGYTVQQVQNAKRNADIEQVLINVFTGDVTKGEMGFAAIPGDEAKFKNSIELTIDYAKALNCKKIHVMAGIVENPTAENDTVYESNLRFAVEKFKEEGIIGIIEPINKYARSNYYLNCFDKGIEIVKKINSPHLKLMCDIFHLQHIQGNITNFMKDNLQYIGHIQIAQVPNRNEPDTMGELDYKYIFSLIKEIGYNGHIGLEYKPKTTTMEGLKWVKNFGENL
ncbi:putative hydroxypyruvate isomerase [Microplitis mediator]|uniref:putative hydroxypyruvate isomerase n=1 Tax=Microplitis mediator TaxID=375433 RepID=UPI002553A2CF|nr:putative hydroxypyruvate isomerase [Microplitis mediator]XP_057323216.1 putative hydroxypyruvate isomerase [Microplitis mediator]